MNGTSYAALAPVARGDAPADVVFRGGRVVNVFTGELLRQDVAVKDGYIVGVGDYEGETVLDVTGKYLCPGLIDAHLHLESTLLTPSELVEAALRCGTTTYLVDPHEATNVSGAAGLNYILEETEEVPANVYVMLPSCVPSLPFEDNGCRFDAADMKPYLTHPRILGLGEVMDYVSTISADPVMHEKLDLLRGRPLDGHAPGLSGKELNAYVLAGIRSDHESATREELLEKARLGVHVLIREGSAARNLEALVRTVREERLDTRLFSFCTDDKHIEDIRMEGHIDHNVRKAISLGIPPVQAIQMATINTAKHYGLDELGAIAPGYQADILVVDDLEQFEISDVYYKGSSTADFRAQPKLGADSPLRRTVNCAPVSGADLAYPVHGEDSVIGVIPGQLVTEHLRAALPQKNGNFAPNAQYNKIAVVERHHATGNVGVGAVSGFGIRGGAIASTVAHDSHNLSVIGDNDEDMLLAVRQLQQVGGGYTLVSGGKVLHTVPLPILGLMSDAGFDAVQRELGQMIAKAHEMGVTEGVEPFILLSFLALVVIPSLRITPRGLFDVDRMAFLEE